MNKIVLHPIGIIHSPYKEKKDIPIQGKFKSEVEAYIELKDKYIKGLKDLDKFSHAIILYYFHKSQREDIEGRPFLEQKKHGIFAIRSPHRPNHIGVSIVKIKSIKENKLYFTTVDVFDGTPVLDIKPYIKYFDEQKDVVCGWLDKHFKNGNIPEKTIIK
ncbi:MAG: tRNA (N6-threonylcarbamoyladenosine(37)-N6)-methyltransferase TrmO [Candidatus Cloacimonetes bacterium]|nr:tRNA (N6-threonylcarbamoyladenosine(37)-N6)-methyltransferase TrmO [Candidatus Cloacimonadota bacterium]